MPIWILFWTWNGKFFIYLKVNERKLSFYHIDSFFNDPRIPSSAQFPWTFPILENIGSFLFFSGLVEGVITTLVLDCWWYPDFPL